MKNLIVNGALLTKGVAEALNELQRGEGSLLIDDLTSVMDKMIEQADLFDSPDVVAHLSILVSVKRMLSRLITQEPAEFGEMTLSDLHGNILGVVATEQHTWDDPDRNASTEEEGKENGKE